MPTRIFPVRPEYTSDSFGGVLAPRLLMSIFLFAAMLVVMTPSQKPAVVQQVFRIFGAMQLLLVPNASMDALLHTARAERELAVINVVTKVLWGVGASAPSEQCSRRRGPVLNDPPALRVSFLRFLSMAPF